MTTKSLILIVCLIFSGSVLFAQNKYIGAAKCKMCHQGPAKGDQYKKWTESKHANAMKSLKGADATNPKCTKCHATASGIDAKLLDGLTMAEGVSCESCHGAGSAYKSPTVMKDKAAAKKSGLTEPNEALCKKCHNSESPNFKSFDYATAVAKIAHKKP